ncbi:nucleotide disphospho-sugar-binding domain-containing protein [Streptomyces sp. enrichment culture]|uniref:nucleotide disphospho-sugar-binding domain-containing protein n=1 Tax=Streptomyces sp. enrichment culture TaxID=1795815 RepID=UPI003F559F9C
MSAAARGADAPTGAGRRRVLFTTCPAAGHFFPMVPLAWALRSAGHEVLVATPGSLVPEVTRAGLPVVPCADAYDMIQVMRPRRSASDTPPHRSADPRQAVADTAQGFARLAELALPGLMRLIERWRPDVVVSEPMELAGPVAATRFGVPRVEHRWGLAPRPDLMAAATAAFRPATRVLATPHAAPPVALVDVCPPSFQHHDVPVGDPMAYVPYNGPSQLPDWALRPAERPRVCVTLGTVLPRYGRMESLLEKVLEALSELDVEAVVGMDERDAAALRERARLPRQVRTASWLPLGATLPLCDVVVHHGGSGTTMTSLVSGVPQLVLPHFADQFANAERIAEAGAGLRLAPEHLTVEAIREAVTALQGDVPQRKASLALAAESAAQPSPSEMASLVGERAAG